MCGNPKDDIGAPGWALSLTEVASERTTIPLANTMTNDDDRAALAEAAVAAANAFDRQQGVFGFGTIRPDRFPSSSYQNWADWRKHFAWVIDANR